MTAIMDLSFPSQRTATATSCIPRDSVYLPGPRAGKSENGFCRCDTWLQIFQNDSKICDAEVTVTPLSNKICKPCKPEYVPTYRKEHFACSFKGCFFFLLIHTESLLPRKHFFGKLPIGHWDTARSWTGTAGTARSCTAEVSAALILTTQINFFFE